MNWFITGTDTGVGKTHVTCLLLRALRARGREAVGFKPFCCGERDDVRDLWEASGNRHDLPLDTINPVWLRPPAAPYTASMIEERPVDIEHVLATHRQLTERFESVLVEGAGGWLVPIRPDYDMADLAADLGLPVAVVVHNRLGAINHTLLTLASIRARGLDCAGLILNTFGTPSADEEIAIRTNPSIIEQLADAPILFSITPGQASVALDIA